MDSVEAQDLVDYLVVGAGPAGLQLGWFLARAGRDYLILESGDAPGRFFQDFPRHRRMISISKKHTGWDDPELNLRMDWNSLLSDDPDLLFTRYTDRYFPDADDYVRYLADFDDRSGEAVHAFVVPGAGRTPDADVLAEFVRAHLTPGHVPQTVTVVSTVPVSAGGKPDKHALAALARPPSAR